MQLEVRVNMSSAHQVPRRLELAHVRVHFMELLAQPLYLVELAAPPLTDMLGGLPERGGVGTVEQALRLTGELPVLRLKIDAQGFDLNVVASAGSAVHRIDYVAMEVVSDDCAALYDGQPKCAEVVEAMFKHGFVPLGQVPCTPNFPRARFNHFCELELVFRQQLLTRHDRVPREVHELHNLHFNGCETLHASDGTKAAGYPHITVVASGSGLSKRYTDVATGLSSNTSFGKLYSCPAACGAPKATAGATPSDPCPW